MRRLSISARLTLFHFLTLTMLTVLLVLGMFAIVGVTREEQFRTRIRDCAWMAEAVVEQTGDLGDGVIRASECDRVNTVGIDTEGLIVTADSDLLAIGQTYPDDFWQVILNGSNQATTRRVESVDLDGPSFAYAIPANDPTGNVRVIIASAPYVLINTVWSFTAPTILGGVGIVVLGVLSILSWVLVRSSLRPVAAMNELLERISVTHLADRLPGEQHRDELGRLTGTINGLLARLDDSFTAQSQLVETQRRFIADASHELRTPLTSIMGFTNMLQTWAINDPKAAGEALAALESETLRMRELVDGLLALARNDELSAPELRPVDVREIVSNAVTAMDMSSRDVVTTMLPDQEVIAPVDAEALRSVLVILMQNAIRYGAAPIEITAEVAGQDVVVRVRDHGPGIAEAHLTRVFDRFYRADASRSTSGNGLGLAIAREIVQQHRGTIRASNAPDGGAEFVVTFPTASQTGP